MTHPVRFVAVVAAYVALASAPVGAQPGFPHGDLVRVSDFYNACSKTIIQADDDCYRGILLASGAEPTITETRLPDGSIRHESKSQPAESSTVGWLGEEACSHAHWKSCILYSDLLKKGRIVPKDDERGIALLQAACASEYYRACEALDDLGVVHSAAAPIPPRPSWVKEPKPERIAVPVPAPGAPAEKPDTAVSIPLGTLQLPKAPIDEPASPGDPIEEGMLERCKAGSGGECYRLARAYETGNGASQDAERAAYYFAKACDLGSQQGCAKTGKAMPKGMQTALATRRAFGVTIIGGLGAGIVGGICLLAVFGYRKVSGGKKAATARRPVARPPTGPRPEKPTDAHA